jgi:hypothetical protein
MPASPPRGIWGLGSRDWEVRYSGGTWVTLRCIGAFTVAPVLRSAQVLNGVESRRKGCGHLESRTLLGATR